MDSGTCITLRYPFAQGQFAGCLLSTLKTKYGLVGLLQWNLNPSSFQYSQLRGPLGICRTSKWRPRQLLLPRLLRNPLWLCWAQGGKGLSRLLGLRSCWTRLILRTGPCLLQIEKNIASVWQCSILLVCLLNPEHYRGPICSGTE